MGQVSHKQMMIREALFVMGAGMLTFIISVFVMQLWNADLQYVFVGQKGDASLELLGIQNIIETGTRNVSDRLGGLWGQQMYDYPAFDAFNYLIMRIIGLFTDNASVILNVFYLLTYPLCAMTAAYAARQLGCSYSTALFASQLFPFMSYHFFRNESHLLLSAYYMVPLGILVVLWFMMGELKVSFLRKGGLRDNLQRNRKYILSFVFCLILSSTGIYYAYFTCFFLLLAVFIKGFENRSIRGEAGTGLTLVMTIVMGGLLNYLPTLFFHLSGGERAGTLMRVGEGAEIYGLKMIDLFMPTTAHHIPRIAELVNKFHASEPMANENTTASLGVLASLAFIVLLIIPIIRQRGSSQRKELLHNTSILAYAGFILATIGGVSALICRLLFSQIRAYNRISVFLFFLALLCAAVLLDAFFFPVLNEVQHHANKAGKNTKGVSSAKGRKNRRWLQILLIPLLIMALYDQIPSASVLPYAQNKQADMLVQTFFQEAEASVPEGTYVYQLPYVTFPEPDISYGSGPYAQLAGYLNTKTLRWSYGALKGSDSDIWAINTATQKADALVKTLQEAGYGAIYIDFEGYPDGSLIELSDQLISLTDNAPIWSQDKQKFFLALS